MTTFSLDCEHYRPLKFFGNAPYVGHDRLLRSNAEAGPIDILFFLDSRGVSGQLEGSLTERLLSFSAERQWRCLMICRPLELTIWASLLNFLALNEIRPSRIVTNMGFVDFTPKKPEILDDAMAQVAHRLGQDAATAVFLEESTRLNGEVIPLYGMRYAAAYSEGIAALARTVPVIVINSPLVSPSCVLPRPRPASFFAALEESNAFNRGIPGTVTVDLPVFDLAMTYDGVHYTADGSNVIFNHVKEYL